MACSFLVLHCTSPHSNVVGMMGHALSIKCYDLQCSIVLTSAVTSQMVKLPDRLSHMFVNMASYHVCFDF